jgi:two-component system response regulator MtrA
VDVDIAREDFNVQQQVLLVEDDEAIREVAGLVLERAGFTVTAVGNGRDAVDRVDGDAGIDLIVLDLMLPGLHGFDVCRQVRSTSGVPIVMLTARADSADVVTGLELGADDYITKPFEPSELVARARAVLRRYAETAPAVMKIHDLVVDEAAHRLDKDGEEVPLTAIEFRLLITLVRHAGQVLSREALLERVWGYDYLGDSRLVDMAIKRLRDKLGESANWPRYITTIRSVGYRFERG